MLGLDAINNFNLSVGKGGFFVDRKLPLKPVMHFKPDMRDAQIDIESDVLFAKRKLILGAMECKTILTRLSNNFSTSKESIFVDAVHKAPVAHALY